VQELKPGGGKNVELASGAECGVPRAARRSDGILSCPLGSRLSKNYSMPSAGPSPAAAQRWHPAFHTSSRILLWLGFSVGELADVLSSKALWYVAATCKRCYDGLLVPGAAVIGSYSRNKMPCQITTEKELLAKFLPFDTA